MLVISDDIYLRQAVYASDNNDSLNLQAILQLSKIPVKQQSTCKTLIKAGVMDENLIKYLPSMAELAFKSLIYGIKTKNVSADSTHKNLRKLEFNIKLPTNQSINWNSVHICHLIQIKKKTNTANNTDMTMIPYIYIYFLHIDKRN